MGELSSSLAVHVVKGLVLGCLLSLTLFLGAEAAWPDDTASRYDPPAEPHGAKVQRAMQRHRCSTEGFAGDPEPSTALVRTGRGRLQLVSFDRGWEIYTGARPGTLVAVCLDPTPARPAGS